MTAPSATDLVPVKVTYDRRIRPNWSEPGRDGFNLDHELMHLLSRPELLADSDHRFILHLRKFAVRGHCDVSLTPLHQRRLSHLVLRFTEPMVARDWLRRQEQQRAEAARQASEANDNGSFAIQTFDWGGHLNHPRNPGMTR